MAEALECERIELYTRFDEIPPDPVRVRFRDWVARHATGEPVAYLVGLRELFSLLFEVSPAVLIPRPETEHVVSAALDFPGILDRTCQVADVGTGSGNIAISIARHAPRAAIVACDVSPAALDVARRNAERLGVEERIRFLHSDLLDAVDQPRQFDLMVSNPPYIGTDEQGTVQDSVRDHEPSLALFAGADGLSVIRRLVESAGPRLVPGGRLIMEISPLIVEPCRELVSDPAVFSTVDVIRDLAGLPRVVVARRASG